jgi:lysozyme
MGASKAYKMLERDEGMRLKPYTCTAGKTTIGCGRNLDDVGITLKTAYQMLDEDITTAAVACVEIFGQDQWQSWSENRRLGWVNLAFNLGEAGLLGFRNTLKAAIGENWVEVERHLRASKWCRQVGSRSDRVIAMICREEFPYA